MSRANQLSAVSIVLLVAGPVGCASIHDGAADLNAEAAPAAMRSDSLTTLESGLDALVGRFNGDADRPRIVALLSPTCGGCIHGAQALLTEAVNAYPSEDLSFFVVWQPMLQSDNEDAARQIAMMFTDRRVEQYWDPDRRTGIAFSRDAFPNALCELLPQIAEDSPIRPHIERSAETDPASRPMWDFAAFYPAGIRWGDTPPLPSSFIRQLAIWMHEDGSTRAMLVTDSFAKPPIESDWFDEVRARTASLLGHEAPVTSRPGTVADSVSPPACRNASALVATGAPAEEPLMSLVATVDPFRERFNAAASRPRFVAIVSSTCGPCISGAVTVNESIVKGFGVADIDVNVVWIDVLPSDGSISAIRASTIFSDPRVTQFHDPNQLLGNAFAGGLVTSGPAWDVYLFYPAGVRWDEAPPAPVAWAHQLGSGIAPASHVKTGLDLAGALHAAMERLGFQADGPAPDADSLARAKAAAMERITAGPSGRTENEPAQCARCAASGTIGQCSVSGWRHVVARRVPDEDGNLTHRFEMTGALRGPLEFDRVAEGLTRHEYSVEGMNCLDCMTRVAGFALFVDGVSRVEVDYNATRLVVFVGAKGESEVDEALRTHLAAAGYQIARATSGE